jgi:hypothetical protein
MVSPKPKARYDIEGSKPLFRTSLQKKRDIIFLYYKFVVNGIAQGIPLKKWEISTTIWG